MNNIVMCIATFTAKEEKIDKLYAALSVLIEPSRSEQGCLSYELYQGLDNPRLFTMIENFAIKKPLILMVSSHI